MASEANGIDRGDQAEQPAPATPEFTVRPIGYVRTPRQLKFDAPSQPDAASQETNRIELLPGHQFDLALCDLASFDRIWVISWFDRNTNWRPRVLPPRGPAQRRGVLSTRSPHRPNPIGLTCTPLLKVDGLILEVGPLDLLDGTPVLDIKPYLRTVDCHPDSSLGWLGPIEEQEQFAPPFAIQVEPKAEQELAWLRTNWGIDFTPRAFRALARDPSPHRTRRIMEFEPGHLRIACGPWRMYFHVIDSIVVVEEIEKGTSDETLRAPGNEASIDREAQIAFAQWKHNSTS